ncbi:MAG: DUF808 family protein [Alphaproteobacteria bacterium]|nr:DUF808 family protein [Alphaproteobacteria bacterium]
MSAGLLALLDDIALATQMTLAQSADDVAMATKSALSKSAGVVTDDVAVGAGQIAGVVPPARELPMIWNITKGSLLNKTIIIPCILGMSALSPMMPWLLPAVMLLAAGYLAFEGAEKTLHSAPVQKILRGKDACTKSHATTPDIPDPAALEKERTKSAVRTDAVLSAEVMLVALGMVTTASLATQAAVLVVTGLILTAGVYGLVAGLVKADDVAMALQRDNKEGSFAYKLGGGILVVVPKILAALPTIGTIALLAVAGHMIMHNAPIQALHDFAHMLAHAAHNPFLNTLAGYTGEAAVGLIAGLVIVGALTSVKKIFQKCQP